MTPATRRTLWVVALLVLGGRPAVAREASDAPGYPDPARFEDAVAAFEDGDRREPPPEGAVLCIGSSSMRMWHDHIQQDLAPLTLIPRGFGGSTMNDVLHYMDRIVLPYKPRAIVLYEGDNDVAAGVSPDGIVETFRAFVTRVHTELPDCRIYVLSIKPSILRWKMWSDMQEANRMLAADCARDPRLTFVDLAPPMLNDAGTPRKELFKDDDLHLNRAGYERWRDVLRPILHQGELPDEAPASTQQAQPHRSQHGRVRNFPPGG